MGKILDMNAKPTATKPELPTTAQITQQLQQLLESLMQLFGMNHVPGFHIVSLGKIMSQLRFVDDPAGRMTPAEVDIIIQKQAQVQLDEMKVWALRQSVPSSKLVN